MSPGKDELTARDPRLFCCAKMHSDIPLTLAEVRNQIDYHIRSLYELRILENEKLNETLSADFHSEIILTFDDKNYTISWLGKTQRFSPQRYRLLNVLWNAPNRQMNYDEFECAIWQHNTGCFFKKSNTVKSAIDRTNRFLRKNSCPYQICRCKDENSQEISSFFLKCTLKCNTLHQSMQ
jgi:DNA-binding response OmpR family regulator